MRRLWIRGGRDRLLTDVRNNCALAAFGMWDFDTPNRTMLNIGGIVVGGARSDFRAVTYDLSSSSEKTPEGVDFHEIEVS